MADVLDIGDEEIEELLGKLDDLSPEELAEIDAMVDELASRKTNQAAYDDLLAFCKKMDSNYLVGRHHRILANMLMAIERGDKDRICVNIRAPDRAIQGRSGCDGLLGLGPRRRYAGF